MEDEHKQQPLQSLISVTNVHVHQYIAAYISHWMTK